MGNLDEVSSRVQADDSVARFDAIMRISPLRIGLNLSEIWLNSAPKS